MNMIKVTLDSSEIQKLSKEIGENLKKFNESKIGFYEFKPFTIYITNNAENIIGGIKGEILDKVCMIHIVWIHEKEKKRD